MGALEPPKGTILRPSRVGGATVGAAPGVAAVQVGRSPEVSWQTTALLRSYAAKTKSAVPSSLLDTITFIIYGSL